nr:MAG TPA_asm: hypothetical protein [Caudoviricetes sp.]
MGGSNAARQPRKGGGQKKQIFCKKAQWRAKKLRERGSNTARQPRKGGGGSHDWS